MTRLWWVRPESIRATPEHLALLDDAERARHRRFLPAEKRHEFLVTRVLVRTVLGEVLGVAPQAVSFTENPWGRPELSGHGDLRFNVTHTEGLVMVIVSTEHEVGVDTERLSRAPALLALAPTVFAPRELRDLGELPPALRPERAVTLWTLKESYIKARGMGLALALDGFAFRFKDRGVGLEVDPALGDDGSLWQFCTLTLGEHRLSAAIGCPPGTAVPLEVHEAPWRLLRGG